MCKFYFQLWVLCMCLYFWCVWMSYTLAFVCTYMQVCEYVWCMHLCCVNMMSAYKCVCMCECRCMTMYDAWVCVGYNACAYVHVSVCRMQTRTCWGTCIKVKGQSWGLALAFSLDWNRVSLLSYGNVRLTDWPQSTWGGTVSCSYPSLLPVGLSPAQPYQVMLQVLSAWSHVPVTAFTSHD